MTSMSRPPPSNCSQTPSRWVDGRWMESIEKLDEWVDGGLFDAAWVDGWVVGWMI